MADIIDFTTRLKTQAAAYQKPEEDAPSTIVNGALMRKVSLSQAMLLMLHKAANEGNVQEAMTLLGFVCQQHPDIKVLITNRYFDMFRNLDLEALNRNA